MLISSSHAVPGLTNEAGTIRQTLRNLIGSAPLSQKVRLGNKTVIVHTNITCPTSSDRTLPVLLEALESAGVQRCDITLINALGNHRQPTEPELCRVLADFITDHQSHKIYLLLYRNKRGILPPYLRDLQQITSRTVSKAVAQQEGKERILAI